MNIQERIIAPSGNQAPDIRIVQLDVLRGLAVLGIYCVNVIVFAMPSGSYALPTMLGEADVANLNSWIISELLIEGTMRGLFSILFGASAMVFLNEAKLASSGLDIVDRYYRRTLLLVVFGMIHAYLLLWPYDILYAYGLIGMFLFPLRKIRPRNLVILGSIILLLGDLNLDFAASYENEAERNTSSSAEVIRETAKALQTEPGPDNYDAMRETMEMQKENDVDLYNSGYISIVRNNIKDVMSQQTTAMYTDHFLDVGGMMLLGMALFKLGILSGQCANRTYWLMIFFGYLLGGVFRGFHVYHNIKYGFDSYSMGSDLDLGYNFGRLPVTLGHIGIIGLMCRYHIFDFITRLLAKVGRMALTSYIMQTVLSIFIFYGFGFGLFAQMERYQLIYVCMGVWLFQILFSISWLKYFKLGPLEWVWRSLIYGKKQPLRRTA